MSFEQARLEELPKWLAGPQAQGYVRALGRAYDVELADVKFAIKQRFPSTCADDALDLVATTFQIERYPGEGFTTYRGRLLAAWTTWQKAGSAGAIDASIKAYGVADVAVYDGMV